MVYTRARQGAAGSPVRQNMLCRPIQRSAALLDICAVTWTGAAQGREERGFEHRVGFASLDLFAHTGGTHKPWYDAWIGAKLLAILSRKRVMLIKGKKNASVFPAGQVRGNMYPLHVRHIMIII